MEVKTLQLANGITLEYAEQGAPVGTPVICLHGYSDSWKSFSLLAPHLPSPLHVLAPSLRGHGRSARPPEGYAPADLAADISLFMDALNLPPAVFIGHSMGATIALRFALDFPAKTAALVLIGAIASFPPNETMVELEAFVATLDDPVPAAFAEEFQRSTLVREVDAQFVKTVIAESLLLPAKVLKAVIVPLMQVDYRGELHDLHKPILLVRGGEDTFSTAWDGEQLLASIAGAQLVVYDGTGHAVHWEEPQRLARDVEAFIGKTVNPPQQEQPKSN